MNQKGITILGLLITVVVIVIIAGVCIYTGRNLLDEAKQTELETNLLLIQAAGKTLYDKKTLDNSVILIGTNLTEENKPEYLYLDSENYYVLDKTNLESLGLNIEADKLELDKNQLKEELKEKQNVYIINYEQNTVFYLNDEFIKNYQVVEYIESTGTQYIDTGIYANQNTGIDIEFLTKNSVASSSYGAIIGARKSSSVNELQLTTYSASSSVKGTLRYGTKAYNAGITADQRMHLVLKNRNYTNNQSIEHNNLSETFTTPSNLTVFALNQSGNITQYGKVQLYSLKLYDGDKLIRDFIPCYRKSDTVAGLYDRVNNKFYTNQGTEEFILGEKIVYIKK